MKTIIIIGIILMLVFGVIGILYFVNENKTLQTCTEEAKLCQDGSSVGRNPDLNCEFSPCPENACLELGCPETTKYVGSANSDKYYPCNCHYAKRIKPENIICFATDEEALAQERTKSEC